eukprot:Partr_v1_DN25951_c0_g3_i3_m68822 putative chitin deacetylase
MQIINTLVLIATTFITIEAKDCGCKSSQIVQQLKIIESNIAYGVDIRGCTMPNTVALTFDDGPAAITPGLLDILAAENVKVTFFVVGENVRQFSATVKRAFDAGHQIASHSNTHANFTALTAEDAESQMTAADAAIKTVIGMRPTYMRFPYGEHNPKTLAKMLEMQYHVIYWSVDTRDWESLNTAAVEKMMSDAVKSAVTAKGSILPLMHDIHPTTIAAVSNIIRNIRAAGLQMVTVHECLQDAGSMYRV